MIFADLIKEVNFNDIDHFFRYDKLQSNFKHYKKSKKGYSELLKTLKTIISNDFISNDYYKNYILSVNNTLNPGESECDRYWKVNILNTKDDLNYCFIEPNHTWLSLNVKNVENISIFVGAVLYEMTFYGFTDKQRQKTRERFNNRS